MSMEGINAATTQSVTGKGADGKGKASGSSPEEPTPPGPDGLDIKSDNGAFQSPNPKATLLVTANATTTRPPGTVIV